MSIVLVYLFEDDHAHHKRIRIHHGKLTIGILNLHLPQYWFKVKKQVIKYLGKLERSCKIIDKLAQTNHIKNNMVEKFINSIYSYYRRVQVNQMLCIDFNLPRLIQRENKDFVFRQSHPESRNEFRDYFPNNKFLEKQLID
jgi:hypothetical protein